MTDTTGEAARSITAVGAGSIGLAWAVVFARARWSVKLYDADPAMLDRARDGVATRLDQLATAGLLEEDLHAVLARVAAVPDLNEAVAGVAWVQECVVENLEVKQDVFAAIERAAPAEAIMASSSSRIAASRWAAGLPSRQRCLVVHPGNPPYLLPVPAPFTDPEVTARAADVLREAGMTPVTVRGEPEGFVFNRLQGAVLREAYCLVRDGAVTLADVDRVMSAGLGRRWAVIGPFATSQLNTRGGIRRHAQVMSPAYERMGDERGQHDPWTAELVERVAQDLEARLPEDEWGEQVLPRDAALIELERARRAHVELFASLDTDPSRR